MLTPTASTPTSSAHSSDQTPLFFPASDTENHQPGIHTCKETPSTHLRTGFR